MFTHLEFSENETACWFSDFPARHFFTAARAGNMSEKWNDKKTAQNNFARCFSAHGNTQNKIASIIPEHSNQIFILPRYWREEIEARCDGLMTSSSDMTLVLRPADCFPILMSTIDRKFVGLIHAGWRGTDLEIARSAVELAVQTYRVEPEDIFIGIGPGIHKCCYGDVETAQNLLKDKRWAPFISNGPLGLRIDLLDFNVRQLQEAGIKDDHIKIAPHCACCSRKEGKNIFFSHYRASLTEEKEGRFAAVISMI